MARADKAVAKTAATGTDVVLFHGIPASVAGIIVEGADPSVDLVMTLRGFPSRESTIELAVQADFDPRIVRSTLPADMPPGRYEGMLQMGDARRPAVVNVDSAPQLRAIPEQLRLEARSGDVVARTLTLLNAGNVPVTVRRIQAFGVFLSGGIERALRRAYVRTLPADTRRVDVIADNLADAHGGLVKMTIVSGSGTVAPGAIQRLAVELRIPAHLAPGTVYGGNWELAGLVYPVLITIPGTLREDPELDTDE